MKSLRRTLVILLGLLGWAGLRPAAAAADTAAVALSSATYAASGGTLSLAVTLNYDPTVTGLGFGFTQPAGWKFVSVSGANPPSVTPNAGDTGALGFAFITAPASPASFTVVVSYPAGLSGTQIFSSVYAIFRPDQSQESPQPSLSVTAASTGGEGGVITPTPSITTQPSPATATTGGTANFAVTATSSTGGTLAYQWLFNGAAISGQTSANLTLTNVQTANAGSYAVAVTAVGGTSITSSAAALAVTAAATPVTITTQPISQSITLGGTVTFAVAASGSGTLSYQWSRNGAAISGATGASYSIANVGAGDQANYTVAVSNGATSATSSPAVLTVTAPAAVSRLLNVSILDASGLSPQNLVVGFTVGGSGTQSVLARAVGPTLSAFSVPNLLADPQLTIVSQATSAQVGFDDDWGGGNALSGAFTQTGAFALPAGSKDAALLLNLAAGSYTANVAGANNTTGNVLLEAYDADTSANPTARLINLSARGIAGSGSNTMTLGFVIAGAANKTVLLRGIGPTLAGFGIAAPLSSTQLTLFRQDGTALQSNTGWGGTAALVAVFNQVNAFQLPLTSADSALLLTLAPGTYTAQLTAAGSSPATGVALLELYDVQ